MKQKLVLISASLSLGYERCNPVITSSNVRASSGFVTPDGVSLSTSCQSKKKKKVSLEEVRICEFFGAISYHPLWIGWLLLIRSWNLETLPYVLLQLPDVHTLRAFSIVDKLRLDSSCLALRRCK